MSTSQLLRDQLRQAHEFLDGTLRDVTPEQLTWQPPGAANSIAATYAHVIVGEDAFLAGLRGRLPLHDGTWNGRTGLNDLPPLNPPGNALPLAPGWQAWGAGVVIDLSAFRSYADAVRNAADEYLATLTDDDLARTIDLSEAGLGIQTLVWILSAGLIGHVLSHWGEIVCLKGLQGGQGFPV